jgi:hypothetical protein
MRELPHDADDLRLAPMILHLEDRLTELGGLDPIEMRYRVGLDSDLPDWDEERRREALLRTVERGIELGGWKLSWDPRGLRVSHGTHHVVLGVPVSMTDYLTGAVTVPPR